MARAPRITVGGHPHHVVQRGHDRRACFRGEVDRVQYLALMLEQLDTCSCKLHAYVLMTNHVHLLVTPHTCHGLPRLMKGLNEQYVRWFNRRHLRTGTLWESRYHASVVESDTYLLACYRYIELNPVRAGLVADPAHYRWSSHPAHAQGRHDPLIQDHEVYRELGSDDASRQRAYRGLFDHDDGAIRQIRASARSGRPLGSGEFAQRVARSAGVELPRSEHGGSRRGSGRPRRIKLV